MQTVADAIKSVYDKNGIKNAVLCDIIDDDIDTDEFMQQISKTYSMYKSSFDAVVIDGKNCYAFKLELANVNYMTFATKQMQLSIAYISILQWPQQFYMNISIELLSDKDAISFDIEKHTLFIKTKQYLKWARTSGEAIE